MPLHGKAFVAIWHGIRPGGEDEYLAWHTYEHMPERLGIPGFLQGRRYIDWSLAPHASFTLYEGAHIETFRSPGYLARLNAPTPWTNAVQPSMTDFLRGGCETLLSLGEGVGGAIAVFRLDLPEGRNGEADLLAAAVGILRLHGVTSVHVGRHEAEVTGAPTAETKLRPSASGATFGHVLMVEGLSPKLLGPACGAIEARLGDIGASGIVRDIYPLDYALRTPV